MCFAAVDVRVASPKTAATNENYIAALNSYYADHDDCLFPGGLRFPYEVSEKGGESRALPVTAKAWRP